MKTPGVVIVALATLSLGILAGHWWTARHPASGAAVPATPAAMATNPVVAPPSDGKDKPARRIKFYRNPMGLPDTSPTPKKDPMGMDYIPVYEGEDTADDAGTVTISTARVQKLGVRTEPAALRSLERTIRALGRVDIDERRVVAVAPKFEGWVEKLHVNATGQPVAKGQPLFDAYAPELVSAQREYVLAQQGITALSNAGPEAQSGMKQLAAASLARLRNWDIPDEQVQALAQTGEARRTLTLRAPAGGIVLEKKALQGMRFMPGEALFQIADISAVWVVADVFEQDIGLVRNGAAAKLSINAFPGRTFSGRVTYVYPTLKPETRTIPVRIELPNPGLVLKPAMFVDVELAVGPAAKVVTVPLSAVIDSGTRQVAFVQTGEGRFEPRELTLGARNDTYVEVRKGIRDGESVVTAANFLIDAESNLKAALGSFGGNPAAAGTSAKVGHKAHGSVISVDAKAGTLTVKHDPVESLKWPAMTMEFVPANAALLEQLKPGTVFDFEFVERKPGEWVITSAKTIASSPPGDAHAGHR